MRLIGGRNFNPRARVGRDQAGSPISQNSRYFNPRARVGRDARHRIIDVLHMISIHAPAWGATSAQVDDDEVFEFQSTRPRGARLLDLTKDFFRIRISIHAPAWGATIPVLEQYDDLMISIHAPAWGATTRTAHARAMPRHFNPRARVGRDHELQRDPALPCHFNPRARVGRDVLPSPCLPMSVNFNPRARVGRDYADDDRRADCRYFNPRARVGRDLSPHPCRSRISRFQSTRPRGARLCL